jgi:hypothetical protein
MGPRMLMGRILGKLDGRFSISKRLLHSYLTRRGVS